jgi:hypothetical protein
MSIDEVAANSGAVRAKRPRSAVTSGRKMFCEGNPNSAWSRRYFDLCQSHIHDVSSGQGRDVLTEAQHSLIRRAASIECELERLDARLSVGETIGLDEYGRAASHLRRIFETLGIERRIVTRDISEEAKEIDRMQRRWDELSAAKVQP